RVDAIKKELAGLGGALTGLGKGQGMGRADPHIVEPAAADIPEHVLLRPTRGDAQVERAAIGVPAGRFRGLNLARCQSVKLSKHVFLCPYLCPYWRGRHWQTGADTSRRQ